MSKALAPLVWVVSSHRELFNEHRRSQQYTVVDEGGIGALTALGLQPVSYPGLPLEHLDAVLDQIDGVLLGGSATNVHPRHFGEEPLADIPASRFDEERDALVLPLVRRRIERGIPLIGFCRGSHEINVALGGSLHQDVKALGGDVEHWEDPSEPLEAQYRERHAVRLREGGELARLTGASGFPVSSLHSQGVNQLADDLVAEAWAEDGLVEACRWKDAGQFVWSFQFHPEWRFQQHAYYERIMTAFRDAAASFRRRRAAPPTKPSPDRNNAIEAGSGTTEAAV